MNFRMRVGVKQWKDVYDAVDDDDKCHSSLFALRGSYGKDA